MPDHRAYMDAGTSALTGTDTGLVGRGEESSRLTGLVALPFAESQVLLILGDPGIGKTVLLASAVRQARAAGMRVLAAAGRESEQDLAFAGLHQGSLLPQFLRPPAMATMLETKVTTLARIVETVAVTTVRRRAPDLIVSWPGYQSSRRLRT